VTQQNRIISRVATTTNDIVDKSADVLREESKKIDDDKKTYTVSDAIETVTRLMDVGITGASDLGKIALEERPPQTTLALGDYVVSVARRMVSQAGSVAKAASVELQKQNYTPDKWLESMTRMIDITIAGTMEVVETIAAGPARFERSRVRSDPFSAPESSDTRVLRIETPLKRDATDDVVPVDKITFDPPTLVPPNVEFHVLVDPSGLESGVYTGTVKAGKDDVSVYIAL